MDKKEKHEKEVKETQSDTCFHGGIFHYNQEAFYKGLSKIGHDSISFKNCKCSKK